MTNRNPEYDFTEIEKRWQKKWDEEKTFHAETSAPPFSRWSFPFSR